MSNAHKVEFSGSMVKKFLHKGSSMDTKNLIIGLLAVALSGVIMYGYVGRQQCDQKCSKSHKVFDLKNIKRSGNIVPIVVIGAGPAGLAAGLYGAAQFDTVVISGEHPSLLTETSYVENYLGAPHQLGMDIIENSRKQVADAGARFIDNSVTAFDTSSWPYTITLDDGSTLKALSVVLATGAQPRKLGIPGEQQYWAKGVSSCARCDGRFYKNKKVIVVGGGDSAVEEATELAHFADQVTVLHRRDQLRAKGAMQLRLDKAQTATNKPVEKLYNAELKEIMGDNTKVTSVKIFNNKLQQEETRQVDGVFLAVGHIPNTDIFKDNVKTDDEGYIVLEDRSQSTCTPGIFAAGEAADPHYRQAIVSAGDGAKAAIDAIEFLRSVGLSEQEAQSIKSVSADSN